MSTEKKHGHDDYVCECLHTQQTGVNRHMHNTHFYSTWTHKWLPLIAIPTNLGPMLRNDKAHEPSYCMWVCDNMHNEKLYASRYHRA